VPGIHSAAGKKTPPGFGNFVNSQRALDEKLLFFRPSPSARIFLCGWDFDFPAAPVTSPRQKKPVSQQRWRFLGMPLGSEHTQLVFQTATWINCLQSFPGHSPAQFFSSGTVAPICLEAAAI